MVPLRYIEGAALIAVIIAFVRRGLLPSYPCFLVFLIAKATRTLCLLPLDYHSLFYAKCWSFSLPVLLVFQMLAILELLDKVVAHHPRIDSKSHRMMVGSCLLIGALAGGISPVLSFNHPGCPSYVVFGIGAWKASGFLSAVGLAFLTVWLSFTQVPLSRNTTVHRWLLAIYLGGAPGLTGIFAILTPRYTSLAEASTWLLEILETACCLAWIFMISRVGEAIPYTPKTMSDEEFAAFCEQYDKQLDELLGGLSAITPWRRRR